MAHSQTPTPATRHQHQIEDLSPADFERLVYWLVRRSGVGLFCSGGSAVMQHVALRLVLYQNGCVPGNYVSFLEYATERIFLRKVGGGYILVHRLLQDYFASLDQG